MLLNTEPLNVGPLNANGAERARAWSRVTVFAVGKAVAYSKVSVLATAELSTRRARAWSKVSVYSTGTAVGYSKVDVVPTIRRARAYSKVTVYRTGRARAWSSVAVLGSGTRWRPQVILGGVDVSERLTGPIWTDGEESASRIAEFTLVPASGPVNPFAYVGALVIIDHITIQDGIDIPRRLFVGKVNHPEYDPMERTIRFDCTNDMPNVVAEMSKAEIDALTGGRYDKAVQGEVRDNWAYAEARMATVAGSLDAGNFGNLRVTPWAGLPIWRAFTEDDIFDGTIGVELPQRDNILNRIDATFEYRFARLRRRTASVSFSVDIKTVVDNALPLLARETVESALEATGWELGAPPTGGVGAFGSSSTSSISYTPFPDTYEVPLNNSIYSYVWVNTEPDTTCMAFTATLWKRFSQTVTERYNMVISAPQSIAQLGTIAQEERGSLASEWDAYAWENDAAATPIVTGVGREVVLDYAPDATTSMRQAAIETLIDLCKVRILDSHRTARVSASIPILPELDIDRACRITYGSSVTAAGKVARVRHTMDMDSGEATTEFWLAISGHGATGLPAVTSETEAPAAPAVPETDEINLESLGKHLKAIVGATAHSPAYSEDMEGWLVNVPGSLNVNDQGGSSYIWEPETQQEVQQPYEGAVVNPAFVPSKAFPTVGFRLTMPGVEDEARAANDLEVDQAYTVDIPQDELTLAA